MSQFRTRASEEFLNAYWETRGTQPDTTNKCLLGLFFIEKAAYEIAYEAANRPAWIGVPIAGLLRILQRMENNGSTGKGFANKWLSLTELNILYCMRIKTCCCALFAGRWICGASQTPL